MIQLGDSKFRLKYLMLEEYIFQIKFFSEFYLFFNISDKMNIKTIFITINIHAIQITLYL